MNIVRSSGFGLFLLLSAIGMSSAEASVYKYTGNKFNFLVNGSTEATVYDGHDRVRLSISTYDAIGADGYLDESSSNLKSWQVTDGQQTITPADGVIQFSIATDSSGDVASWDIYVGVAGTPIYQLFSHTLSGDFIQLQYPSGDQFAANFTPGAWSTATVVPLPAALPLAASALAGLGGIGWLKRRRMTADVTAAA